MKNKKGFTLTEILVVIVIIGVIMSIAIPAAMAISNSIKERAYVSKMETYVAAAELYAKNNGDIFGASTVIQISVETLMAYGYVDEEYSCVREYGCITDPRDDSSIMNDEPITIKKNKNIYIARSGPMEVELTLSFLTNGATSISATGVGCQTLNGSSCNVTLPTITREGYTILGWNKLSSATTATYAPGATISIYENGTYYAITSKSLSFTFNKNTAASIGATSGSCTMYNTQTSCSLTMPTITPNSGYSVIGWNTNSAATTKQYSESQVVSMTSGNTYYAITKLITYTCTKTNPVTVGCSYSTSSAATTACNSAKSVYPNTSTCSISSCTANEIYDLYVKFLFEGARYNEDDAFWNCYLSCSNVPKPWGAGEDWATGSTCGTYGFEECVRAGTLAEFPGSVDTHYCVRTFDSMNASLYWGNATSETSISLRYGGSVRSCSESSKTLVGATYTYGYSYNWYDILTGQTSCPAGYTAVLE